MAFQLKCKLRHSLYLRAVTRWWDDLPQRWEKRTSIGGEVPFGEEELTPLGDLLLSPQRFDFCFY